MSLIAFVIVSMLPSNSALTYVRRAIIHTMDASGFNFDAFDPTGEVDVEEAI